MTIDNAFYAADIQGPYEMYSLGRLALEDGGTIPDLQLAVTVRGTLNDDKSNAILITTRFSGTHQIWDMVYIGPGRPLDPNKYFIVIVNQVGNGLSTSPHSVSQREIAMSKFPNVSIGDDVRAQEQLLREVLGIEHPNSGLSFILPAFAAAFLGATAITPGRYNAWGAFIAV